MDQTALLYNLIMGCAKDELEIQFSMLNYKERSHVNINELIELGKSRANDLIEEYELKWLHSNIQFGGELNG